MGMLRRRVKVMTNEGSHFNKRAISGERLCSRDVFRAQALTIRAIGQGEEKSGANKKEIMINGFENPTIQEVMSGTG